MRKKSQEELGTLVTREMKVMLQDEGLTKEQRFDILAAVMFDTPVKNVLLGSFAKSLKAGFERVNSVRYKAINSHRESAKEEARRAREAKRKLTDIDASNNQLPSIDNNSNQLSTTSTHIHRQDKYISPYKPPKGGGKSSKNVSCGKPQKTGRVKKDAAPAPETSGGEASGTGTVARVVEDLAALVAASEAFGHMRVNERALKRCLLPIVRKNCAAGEDGEADSGKADELERKITDGLAAWTAAWKADDWQYAPGKISKWLADEKYLQPPRKKAAPAEGRGCGECGAEIV